MNVWLVMQFIMQIHYLILIIGRTINRYILCNFQCLIYCLLFAKLFVKEYKCFSSNCVDGLFTYVCMFNGAILS